MEKDEESIIITHLKIKIEKLEFQIEDLQEENKILRESQQNLNTIREIAHEQKAKIEELEQQNAFECGVVTELSEKIEKYENLLNQIKTENSSCSTTNNCYMCNIGKPNNCGIVLRHINLISEALEDK